MGDKLVPKQEIGSKLDLRSTTVCRDVSEAISFFNVVKSRLMNVNQWDEICDLPSSVFRLMDDDGNEVSGLVQKGNYIRIDIPGPGTQAGEGYDWVKVESITEQTLNDDSEILSITVRPSHHPLDTTNNTAHFFSDEATSTFQVKRERNEVAAEIHGRNEQPNTNTEGLIDNVRNTLVGWSAKLGFSYPQWKGLTEGLVKQ